MNSIATSIVIIPGVVALLLCLLFTYLYQQSRQAYFRAWQIAWACYSIHYALDAFRYYYPPATIAYFFSSLFSVAMGVSIFVSTRLTRGAFRVRWYDWALALAGTAAACVDLRTHMLGNTLGTGRPLSLGVVFLSAVLLYCSAVFYLHAHRKGSVAFQLLAFSLALWAVLLGAIQSNNLWMEMFGSVGHVLGPVPQMLLGIAMVMVLFENERNAVQENTLALSTLGADPRRLLSADDLLPSMQSALDRLAGALSARRAVIYISERWRGLLPSVERGFSSEFLDALTGTGAGEYICELAYRQGGLFTAHDLTHMTEPLPIGSSGTFADFKKVLTDAGIRNLTAVSLQTREYAFGVILFPHAQRKAFGTSGPRLMVGLALQLGLTLDNYLIAHDAHRRTQEYELLTEIGQAISSRLDQDEVLRTIHAELGQIFNTSDFYIAFQEGDEIRFELEVENDRTLPKRSRKLENAFTEYVIRTGQPLLIRSDLEKTRARLGVTYRPEHPAKCLCAAPILLSNKPAGVMVAMSTEREFVFEQRDLDVLMTAAGQVSVAVENARLFADEQRRSRQLAFLNNISRTAISSDDPVHMLGQIVGEIQKNFSFDHIGIGLLDYGTKEIEIKAEAGATAHAMGKRIPLGIGILGRVARTGERALVHNGLEGQMGAILPESRSVLCIPITYGETLLGALNIESRSESAFLPQDVLILNTLADLASYGTAQCVRLPEAATAIDHRRSDGNQDPAVLLGSVVGGVEARFALRTPVLRRADRSRQIQGSQRHHGSLRRRPGAGPRRAAARAESPGSRTWWRAMAETNSSSSCLKPAPSRPRCWPSACASGSPPTPCSASTTSPAVSAWPVSPLTASPSKTSFAWPMRACMFRNVPAAIGSRRLRSSPQAKSLPRNGSRFPPTSKASCSASTTGRSISKSWLQCW